jgi:hypothetical protein
MRRISAKARHDGSAMATENQQKPNAQLKPTANKLSGDIATQNQSQGRTEMQKYARQVNQRPLGEILLEKEKEKR